MTVDLEARLLRKHSGPVHVNMAIPRLVETAILRGEGVLSASGALRVATGKYTGRSPNDKFIVDTVDVHNDIWWENNLRISEAAALGLNQWDRLTLQRPDETLPLNRSPDRPCMPRIEAATRFSF